MRRAGLPGRDLRILDPMLSYPSTILGRERAIVLNLEHIKAIITAQEVLLLNSKDPAVAPFVADLQQRLPPHSDIQEQQVVSPSTTNLRVNSLNVIDLPRQVLFDGGCVVESHMSFSSCSILSFSARWMEGVSLVTTRRTS